MPGRLKVAAVVVTYNRKELLKECLDALLSQTRPLDSIILMDNASTDGTPEFLREHGYLGNPVIDYVRLPENTGGAGGFHHGVKRGHEKGFDWVWLMDDDAEPFRDCLFLLLKSINMIKNHNIGVIAPVVINENGDICKHCRALIDINKFPSVVSYLGPEYYISDRPLRITHASFVGPLISKNIINRIGYPDKNFFIYYDDLEYSIRINNFANIYLIPKAYIIHKERKSNTWVNKSFLWIKRKRTNILEYIFSYFDKRNLVYVHKKYNSNNFKNLDIIIYLIKSTIAIILLDDHKLLRLNVLWSAYLDGLFCNFRNNYKYINFKL